MDEILHHPRNPGMMIFRQYQQTIVSPCFFWFPSLHCYFVGSLDFNKEVVQGEIHPQYVNLGKGGCGLPGQVECWR